MLQSGRFSQLTNRTWIPTGRLNLCSPFGELSDAQKGRLVVFFCEIIYSKYMSNNVKIVLLSLILLVIFSIIAIGKILYDGNFKGRVIQQNSQSLQTSIQSSTAQAKDLAEQYPSKSPNFTGFTLTGNDENEVVLLGDVSLFSQNFEEGNGEILVTTEYGDFSAMTTEQTIYSQNTTNGTIETGSFISAREILLGDYVAIVATIDESYNLFVKSIQRYTDK